MAVTRHSRIEGGVRLTIDERSLRSFKRNVDALITSVGDFAEEDLMDFCEDVLADSNEMVPIDTGTLAESADYKISVREGVYTARVGYGQTKNRTNPRTGKKASSYAGVVHEDLTVQHDNGEAKFLEKAIAKNASGFYDKMGNDLRDSLAKFTAKKSTHKEYSSPEAKEAALEIMRRKKAGFTARHKGMYLPYPPGSNKSTKWKSTKRDAHGIRAKVRGRYSRQNYQREYGYSPEHGGLRGSYGTTARKQAMRASRNTSKSQMRESYHSELAKKARSKRTSVNKLLGKK